MIHSKSLRLVVIFLGAALIALVPPGCVKNKDGNNNAYTLSGPGTGQQEVPAVSTTAAGSITGTYDADANTLNYTIYWSNLSDSVTAMHFHGPAAPGQNASPVIDIIPETKARTGKAVGSAILADSMEVHLLGGKLYYNIHSKTYRAGEVRGQVFANR